MNMLRHERHFIVKRFSSQFGEVQICSSGEFKLIIATALKINAVVG